MVKDSPPQSRLWATAVHWLAGVTALIYVFSRFPPYLLLFNYSNSNPDFSWEQTLHRAFEQHLQFGRDIVFSYGPWGFLSGGYYPPTFTISVIAWIVLSLVFGWAGWCVAGHFSKNQLVSWCWLMGFIGVAGMPVEQNFDLRVVALLVLLLFLHFFVEGRSVTVIQALLALSLGVLSLTKFNIFIEAVIVVGVIATDNVFRQRHFPWLALLFAGSVLFFWVAATQRLDSIGPYFCHSWWITSGYTEAMMQTGDNEIQAAAGFLLAVTMLVVLTGYVAWKRHRHFGILPVTGLGAILFLTFKHGYVRQDDIHEVTATLSLLLIALVCLAVTWPVLQREKPWLCWTSLILLAGILFFSSSTFNNKHPKDGMLAQLARTFTFQSILAPAKLLNDTGTLQKGYEGYLAVKIRNEFPIPPVEGDVDIYPWNQVALFAHGLRYHPRPVIQSYSAYTPELAELNAAHLRSDRAASNILFEIRLENHRYPSLDDGRSWPELLTRYDIKDRNGTFVLLKRSAAPREYRLTPFKDLPVHFGEPVMLPDTTNEPIWAEMAINKTILGSAVSTFYKPPVLMLMVSLRDGRQVSHRLIPGMVRGGFLLSPLIRNEVDFVSLAAADKWSNLAGLEVTSVTVSADTQSHSTSCYQSPMWLRLYHLDYPRQDLKGMATGSAPIHPTAAGKARPDKLNHCGKELP
jgi:hypothetical protein